MAKSNYEIRIKITPEGFEVIDGAAGDLKRMERAAGGVDNKFAKMERTLGRVASGVERLGKRMMLLGTGIVGGIGVLTYAGIKYNATVEQLQARLKIFLGTQKKVNEAYEWASKVTLRVPMTRRDIIPIVTMLEQYGFAYDEWTESVIDAAAATKRPGESIQAQMETIALAFGRIKMGQKGIGLLMLRRAGIAVENAGIKFGKAGRVIDEPRVVLEKLKKYLDTEFKGAAEEFGNTWEGQMMKIKSLTMRALGAGVAPMFDKLKTRVVMFTDYIASPVGQAKMKEWASILGRMLEAALKFGDQLATKVLPKVMQFADWFGKLKTKSQWMLTLFPLIGGAILVLAAKTAILVLKVRAYATVLGQATLARNALTAAEAKGMAGGVPGAGIAAKAGAAGMAGAMLPAAAWTTLAYSATKPAGYNVLTGKDITNMKELEGGRSAEVMAGIAGMQKEGAKWTQAPLTHTPRAKPLGSTPWGKTPFPQWEAVGGGGGLGGVGGDGAAAGGGGGGGGGIGTRARGGTTIYQTIENVEIKANKIDEKSLLAATRKIVTSELPA